MTKPLSPGCRQALLLLLERRRHNPFLSRRAKALEERGLIELKEGTATWQLSESGRVLAKEIARR
ncbi:hypothetical protein OV203_32275 [Nannocystis sp. ILAH1]|uniref:hypothetical protein n=1 Tax=Nannocystis sp. ILAH1 TaxID=2996789 RepID=UPI002270C019|nr:hypothetical protein [Nannocystis sp. ILAH1]MCY0991860.1 hypothetical protein [Nannocystis sp. ILAH1]